MPEKLENIELYFENLYPNVKKLVFDILVGIGYQNIDKNTDFFLMKKLF